MTTTYRDKKEVEIGDKVFSIRSGNTYIVNNIIKISDRRIQVQGSNILKEKDSTYGLDLSIRNFLIATHLLLLPKDLKDEEIEALQE